MLASPCHLANEAAIFWAPQKGCPQAHVFRVSPRRMLCSPCKQGISEHPPRKHPIYKGFRGAYPEIAYLHGVPGTYLEHLYRRGFPGMSFRVFDHDEAPRNPFRRSCRRGAAWPERGFDCLSESELSSPPTSNPRQGVFCAWGRVSLLTFFGEAKKVSGARCRPAQRHQKKSCGQKSARRPWQFLYLKYLRAPALQPLYLGHLRHLCPKALYL